MRNVLFITADQWRGDCLSSVGHRVVETPVLDRLAAEGVQFTRHFTNAVPCGPSRACMHTGMYLHNHRSGTNGTPLDARFTNWALETRKAGFSPFLVGYTHTAPDPRYLSPDDVRLTSDAGILPGIHPVLDMATDCSTWRDWLQSLGYEGLPEESEMTYAMRKPSSDPDVARPMLFDKEHSDTHFMVDCLLEHLNSLEGDETERGWIAHLSLRAPHPPWSAPEPYNARYCIDELPGHARRATREAEQEQHPWLAHYLDGRRNAAYADEHRHRLLQASYYGLMSEVDDNLGRLFEHLQRNGQYEETLIVFTSDHGEQMGDHWMLGKAGYFDQSYHIPLIIRDPREAARGSRGLRFEGFTEHVDLVPTLLEWLGLPVPRQCDGGSLLPIIEDGHAPSNWRSEVHWEFDFRDPVSRGVEDALGIQMEHCALNVVRDARYKYVHFTSLPPLLFDLEDDPQELHDLSTDPAHVGRVRDMAQRLLSWRMAHTDKTLSHMRVTRSN
ncbi:MAG: alkaline phosphatase family protein, partial [Pseudomonadales bacterium]